MSEKTDTSDWTPWQRYNYRILQQRRAENPNYDRELAQRSAEFLERIEANKK